MLDFNVLSQRAIEILHAAGWTPARKVETDKYLAAYAEEGLDLPVNVQEFLSVFG